VRPLLDGQGALHLGGGLAVLPQVEVREGQIVQRPGERVAVGAEHALLRGEDLGEPDHRLPGTLRARLGIGKEELEGLLRLVRSQLDLSLSRLLHETAG
jgi:hypothetical protein